MKKLLLPAFLMPLIFSGCTYQGADGEQHVSIMFWFFIAGISISVIVILYLIYYFYKKRKK